MRGEPHWVPLPTQAVDLLHELRLHSHGDLLFPNQRDPRRPMVGATINALLTRTGWIEVTSPHGLRSLFSTYMNSTGVNPDVVEKILAHRHRDAIRFTYNRSEYRQEQREILQAWADQVYRWYGGKSAVVVPIRSQL